MIQRYYRLAGCLLPVFIICTGVALLGARAKPSGDDPFTPTKREWLCLVFNAEESVQFFDRKNYAVVARPSPRDANTVLLKFGAKPDLPRETRNELLSLYKDNLQGYAKFYGFEDWLVIEEHIRDFQ